MDAAAHSIRSIRSNADDAEACATPDNEPSEPGGDDLSCTISDDGRSTAPAELKRQRNGEAGNWFSRAFKDAYNDIAQTWLCLNQAYLEYSYSSTSNHVVHDEQSFNETSQSAFNIFVMTIGDILFGSWLNLLLIFVPAGILAYIQGAHQVATFALNAIAIIPLSSILTDSTERISMHAGDTIGALVNISLGNVVELILLIVALLNGHTRIVRESILGSLLVNLLPILGSALLAGAMTQSESRFNTADAQLLVFLLLVSTFALMIPTAFSWAFAHGEITHSDTVHMSRIVSILVLLIYVVYIIHELKASYEHQEEEDDDDDEQDTGIVSFPQHDQSIRTLDNLVPPPRTIRFADENSETNANPRPSNHFELGTISSRASISSDYDVEEQRGRSRTSIYTGPYRRSTSIQPLLQKRTHSQSMSITSNVSNISGTSSVLSRRPPLNHILRADSSSRPNTQVIPSAANTAAAIAALITASLAMSLTAQLLVSTIDDLASQTSLTNTFIGLIILPLVGNVAESSTVVAVAARDKLDLAIAVSVGSAVQIALCVAPVVVISSWGLGKDVLLLDFDVFEIFALIGATVLVVNLLVDGGITNAGLRGALMCACYVMVGLGAYFGT